MTKFIEVHDWEYFGQCDECRGIHNVLDLRYINDGTVVLCEICYTTIKKREEILESHK